MKSIITSGLGLLSRGELRCKAQLKDSYHPVCGKLVAKNNKQGLICGSFKCERCGQFLDVEVSE